MLAYFWENLSNFVLSSISQSHPVFAGQQVTVTLKYIIWKDGLDQGLANYSLWTKSGPPPVFINKVLLEHSQLIHVCIVYGWLSCYSIDWSNCDRDHEAGNTYYWTL